MKHDADILIVGGGLAGPATALAMARAGLRSIVIDAVAPEVHADPAFDGRAFALSLGSSRMLTALGLWGDLAPDAQPILDVRVSEGDAGAGAAPFDLHFDHAEIDEGPMGHILEDRFLRRALAAALLAEPLVQVLAPARVVAQQTGPGMASITLDTGTILRGSVLVGCDGRASAVARRAGIGRAVRDYGQRGLVCAIAHQRPHNGCAHQIFLPAGPFAILPLPGNRSSLVWSESAERARVLESLGDAAWAAELRLRIGDYLGEITPEGARHAYPLNLTIAYTCHAPGLALVGDAAHGIHPLAGQGLNLAFRDVATLAQVLAEARRRGEDIGAPDVLARYGRWRGLDTISTGLASDTIGRLFAGGNPLVRTIRQAGLAALGQMPALRRAMIREAAGLTGDQPRLLRGHPL